MALIIGTTGDDAQIIDLVNQPVTIYGDQQGTLTGVGGDDRIFGCDFNDTLIGDADGVAAGATGGNDLIVGGEGDDRIFGDAFELFGVGGNDVLRSALPGESLSDVIYGDAERLRAGAVGGDDHVEGMFVVGDGATLEDARGGNDKLHAEGTTAAVTPTLHGDASGAISGTGVGGDDVLRGSARGDRLFGDAGSLEGTSQGGNDRVEGKAGDDFVLGDATEMIGSSVGGDDTVRGSSGDDEVYGDAVNLSGSARGGDDQVYGGRGDDRLWGDGKLSGGAQGGNDVFNFVGTFDDDAILDFRQGEDQLAFTGLLPIDVTIAVSGNNSILSTVGGDSVTVVDFTGPFTVGTDIIFLA